MARVNAYNPPNSLNEKGAVAGFVYCCGQSENRARTVLLLTVQKTKLNSVKRGNSERKLAGEGEMPFLKHD